MKRLVFAMAAVLTIAAPATAVGLPDITITSSSVDVAVNTQFTHTYTVRNIGLVSGKYQTTDPFGTALTVVTVDANCFVDTILFKGRRQQAGITCNGTLAPGASVTITETLRSKFTSWSGSVEANRNHNIQAESSYANNAAFWEARVH